MGLAAGGQRVAQDCYVWTAPDCVPDAGSESPAVAGMLDQQDECSYRCALVCAHQPWWGKGKITAARATLGWCEIPSLG
jgi:hypothetical protein